jgi:hypothetical protein
MIIYIISWGYMCFLRENREVFLLAENTHKLGVDIGKIIFIPTLDPHNPSDELFDFFHRIDKANVDFLEHQFKGFKEAHSSYKLTNYSNRNDFAFEFIMDLHRYSLYPFIVQLKFCRNVDQVFFNREGVITSCDSNWNSFRCEWVFAMSMEHAMQQGILLGNENLLKLNEKDCV